MTSRARDDRSPAALSQASRAVPWVGVLLALLILGAIAWLNEAAARFERARSGRIVAISSIAGDRGRGGSPASPTTAVGSSGQALRPPVGAALPAESGSSSPRSSPASGPASSRR